MDIEFIKMLIENHVLILTGPVTDGARTFGWWIINALVYLVDGLESVATKIYSFNDFFDSKGVNDLLNAYKPLIFGILVIALLFLGYSVMLQKKKDRKEIPTNILISAMVIIALPLFMTKLGDLTEMFVNYNISEQQSSAKEIVKDNISDLYYLDRNDFKMKEKKNDIPASDIMNIDLNEKLNASKISSKDFRDNFKRKLVRNEKGNEELIDLDKGFFGMFEEGYYRYNANFMIIIFSLIITGITLLCIALKVIGIIFELGFKKIFATLIAMADISDGRKLKAVVMDIVSSFAVLMVTSVLLKMYVIFSAFLGSKTGNYSVLSLVALAGVSWRLIDAPNIVERILGIDAGVKSNWASVLAGYEGIKGAGRVLAGAGRLARKGFKFGKNTIDKLSENNTSNSGGINGNENSGSNSNNTNNRSTNNNTTSNNGSKVNNNSNKSNNPNNNINRNNGIYTKKGDNVNNNQNINNNSKNSNKENSKGNNSNNISSNNGKEGNKNNIGNKSNNINTDKGTSIHGSKELSDNDKFKNLSKNNGNPIYDKKSNNTDNLSSKGNITNNNNNNNNFTNGNNKGVNNISSSNKFTSGNMNNNFNIKSGNKTNYNGTKNYNVGNQNKWNIKGKGNKR